VTERGVWATKKGLSFRFSSVIWAEAGIQACPCVGWDPGSFVVVILAEARIQACPKALEYRMQNLE